MKCDPKKMTSLALSTACDIVCAAAYPIKDEMVEAILLNGLLADILYEQDDRDYEASMQRWR